MVKLEDLCDAAYVGAGDESSVIANAQYFQAYVTLRLIAVQAGGEPTWSMSWRRYWLFSSSTLFHRSLSMRSTMYLAWTLNRLHHKHELSISAVCITLSKSGQGHVEPMHPLQHATSGISKATLVQACVASQLECFAAMSLAQYMPDGAENRGRDGCCLGCATNCGSFD